ncbi:MAG: PAS domain S-box protein [Candidatus Berkelbacteria bacterium]|nr:MAG: PAS domain S-box protein [Candidatus Berkelbacteria bacterium]QQG51992.1 MAG: PAS domain S-box protein [Candidatus Berkelbacteria bacterium]
MTRRRLDELTDVLAQISVGDLSANVRIPKKEDEFTDLYVGVQLILEVFRENIKYFEAANEDLARNIEKVEASSLVIEQEKVIDEAILESIGEGLVVTDISGKIMVVNRQAEEMFGIPSREMIGKKWSKTVKARYPDGAELTDEQRPSLLSITRHRKVNHPHLIFSTRRVKELAVAITSTPILIGKTVIGSVSVFRDIKEEREIDLAKTEVISFTSHQLRTPLSVINWYSEVLLKGNRGKLTRPQHEYLKVIHFTTRRMIELVNTFLSISRIQLGKLVVEYAPVDVRKVVTEVYKELIPQVTQRDLKFTTQFDEKLPKIISDAKLLRIVFQNLFGNAVKYTPDKGSISVEVSVIRPKDNLPISEGVLVVIRDTGYGIPRKQQDKVFTKLFRAENAKIIDTEGAGLGLYMVKSILNHTGGDIWLRSRINRGTVFFVVLPHQPKIEEKSR